MTWLLALLTFAYFLAALVHLVAGVVPMAVFLWGGLILIIGWYVHDTARARHEGAVV